MPSPAVLPNELIMEARLYSAFGYDKPFRYLPPTESAQTEISRCTFPGKLEGRRRKPMGAGTKWLGLTQA